jgi:hypothetical protein
MNRCHVQAHRAAGRPAHRHRPRARPILPTLIRSSPRADSPDQPQTPPAGTGAAEGSNQLPLPTPKRPTIVRRPRRTLIPSRSAAAAAVVGVVTGGVPHRRRRPSVRLSLRQPMNPPSGRVAVAHPLPGPQPRNPASEKIRNHRSRPSRKRARASRLPALRPLKSLRPSHTTRNTNSPGSLISTE